jgi:hypothetical protein
LRLVWIEALRKQQHSGMLFWSEKNVQAPRVVHHCLQTSDALVFNLLVFTSSLTLAQQVYDLIDAGLAKFFDPADGITGECNTQALYALVDLSWTSVCFFEVVNVVAWLLEAGI